MAGHLLPQGGPRVVKAKTVSSKPNPPLPTPQGSAQSQGSGTQSQAEPAPRPMNRGEMARAARDAATQTGMDRRRSTQAPGSNQSITSMSDMSRGPRYVQTTVCPSALFGAGETPPQISLACRSLTVMADATEWATRARALLQMIAADPGIAQPIRNMVADPIRFAQQLEVELPQTKALTPGQVERLCALATLISTIVTTELASASQAVISNAGFFMDFLGAVTRKGQLATAPMSKAKKAAILLAVSAAGGGAIYWFWKRRKSRRR